MANGFDLLLPTPDDTERKRYNPEYVMEMLSNDLMAKYGSRIVGTFASTAETSFIDSPVLDYTYYLIFSRHDNFSYPLFMAKCLNRNGSYPLLVQSHYGPPTDYGQVDDYDTFKSIIEKILKEDKTRTLILSMY